MVRIAPWSWREGRNRRWGALWWRRGDAWSHRRHRHRYHRHHCQIIFNVEMKITIVIIIVIASGWVQSAADNISIEIQKWLWKGDWLKRIDWTFNLIQMWCGTQRIWFDHFTKINANIQYQKYKKNISSGLMPKCCPGILIVITFVRFIPGSKLLSSLERSTFSIWPSAGLGLTSLVIMIMIIEEDWPPVILTITCVYKMTMRANPGCQSSSSTKLSSSSRW